MHWRLAQHTPLLYAPPWVMSLSLLSASLWPLVFPSMYFYLLVRAVLCTGLCICLCDSMYLSVPLMDSSLRPSVFALSHRLRVS